MGCFSLKWKGMFVVLGEPWMLFLARRNLGSAAVWLEREATSWVTVHLPLAWEQDWFSIFHLQIFIGGNKAMLRFRNSSTPLAPMSDSAVVSLDLAINGFRYSLSVSNQFFSGGISHRRNYVSMALSVQPGCWVDRCKHGSAWGRLEEQIGAKEHFSNYNVPMNHLEILL